jgi:hypothetical protein
MQSDGDGLIRITGHRQTTECCGEMRTSSFCPNCGKNLTWAAGLEEVLGFLERSARMNTARKEQIERRSREKGHPVPPQAERAAQWAKEYAHYAQVVRDVIERAK